MIFPPAHDRRRNPDVKDQDEAASGITVPPDWPIQRFHSTLPAARSTDPEPAPLQTLASESTGLRKGLGGGTRQTFVMFCPIEAKL